MAVNRVQYGNSVIMDITDTTATSNSVMAGETFYTANGEKTTGSLGVVTHSANGLMAAADKIKLDNISAATPYYTIGESLPILHFLNESDNAKISTIEININGEQNFQGYSVPWADGARGNTLPTFRSAPTINGLYCSVYQGKILISGTIDSTVTISAPIGTFLWDGESEMWLSGVPVVYNLTEQQKQNYVSQYKLYVASSDGAKSIADDGIPTLIEEDHGDDGIVTYEIPGIPLQNETGNLANKQLHFEIELSAGTYDNLEIAPALNNNLFDYSYMPYNNICPITNYSSVTITQTNGNIVNTSMEFDGIYLDTNGYEHINNNFYTTTYKVINDNEYYYWIDDIVTRTINPVIALYNSDKALISAYSLSNNTALYVPAGVKYYRLSLYKGVDYHYYLGFYSDNNSTYVAQNITQSVINLPRASSNGKIILNLDNTITLITNKKCITAPTTGWTKEGSLATLSLPDKKLNTPVISSHYECYTVPDRNAVSINIGNMTIEELMNYFTAQANAGTPVQFLYELASSLTDTFTYTQLTLSSGINNIWTDSGSVATITYSAQYAEKVVDEHNNAISYLDWSGNYTVKGDVYVECDNNGVGSKVAKFSDIPTNVSAFTNDVGYLTQHQDISHKADKSAAVSTVEYDTTNKKITETINGTTTDVVSVSTIKTDLALVKGDVGLDNVDNTSDTNKPISTATQTALDLKAPKASPIFTGSISLGRTGNVGIDSIATGYNVSSTGIASHAEGNSTTASGNGSHAEGSGTIASGADSHAEGGNSVASGQGSHAEGLSTYDDNNVNYKITASGAASHAEGLGTAALNSASHSEGYLTTASGTYSHAEGKETVANHKSQHVFGEYNNHDPSTASVNARGNFVEIVGNGTSTSNRSNARTLDWNGNEYLQGDLYFGCESDSTDGTKLGDVLDLKASKRYVDEMVPAELAIEVETHTSSSGNVYVDTPFDPGDILLINGEYRKAIKRYTGGIYIQNVVDNYTVSITSKEMNADSYEKVQVLDDIDSYKEGFPFYSGILLIKDASFVVAHRCIVTNRVEQARAQLTSWGFSKTSSAYKTMEAFYAQKPTPEHLILSCYPASETEAQALQTYMTMFGGYYERQTDFYTVLVANSMTGTRSLELANYVESMDKACVVFIPVIGDVSSVTASGSLADQIYQANLKRTFVFHLSDISECGAVAGFAIATLRSRSLQFIEGTPKGITLIEYSGSDTSDLRALMCNYIYGGINPGSSRKKQFWALADEDMKAYTLHTPASITIGSTTITESQLQALLALLN